VFEHQGHADRSDMKFPLKLHFMAADFIDQLSISISWKGSKQPDQITQVLKFDPRTDTVNQIMSDSAESYYTL